MIKLIFKDILNKNFYIKLYLVLLIFCFFAGKDLSIAKAYDLNLFEYVILSISNGHYLLYFMITIFIFIVFSNIKPINNLIIVRSNRFISYFISKNIVNLIISIIFVLLHLICSFVIGVFKLKISNNFTNTDLLGILQNNFNSPIQALLCISTYMILGLFFITFLIEFINYFMKRHVTMIFVFICYILMTLDLGGHITNSIYLINLNNYFILNHAIVEGKAIELILFQISIICIGIVFIKKNWWIKYKFFKKKSFFLFFLSNIMTKRNITIMVISSILLNILLVISLKNGTILDSFIHSFLGYNIGSFQSIELTKLLIFNGIPLYLLAIFYADYRNSRSPIILTRMNKKFSWFLNLQIANLIFIIIYISIQIIINIIISYIFLEHEFKLVKVLEILNVYSFDFNNIYYLILSSIVLRIIEIMIIQIVFFIIISIVKDSSLAFYINLGFYSLMIFSNEFIKYIPYGVSSIHRILGYGSDLYESVTLSGLILLSTYLIGIIYLKNNKFKNIV